MGRPVNGVTLTFHLAGINNQNFLMRDAETGTYWQQISGHVIAGPLAGKQLTLIHSDELTFALRKTEQPKGTDGLAYVDGYAQEGLVDDRIGSGEIVRLVGADKESVRAFHGAIPGSTSTGDIPLEFFRTPDGTMIDSQTGSRWNFKGCAIDGRANGACLARIEAIQDYWFDWRQYHPDTTVFTGAGRVRHR